MSQIKKYVIGFLVAITLVLFSVESVHAQEPTPTPTPTVIQYDLAFPGMLPDHPLYKVKVLRDKLQLITTIDPTKRINLLLHFADKGMLAGAILVDKSQWRLAKETLLKAEHNMTLLTPEFYKLEEPIDQALLKKVQTASLKHQEVLSKLRQRVPTDDQTVFSQVIDFSKRNQSEIEKYIE